MSEDRLRRLGEKLRQARLARGETQQQTAAAVGIHRTHLSRIEGGGENITLRTLWAFADHLGVTTDSLVGDQELHDVIAELTARRSAAAQAGQSTTEIEAELDRALDAVLGLGQTHADSRPMSD
ncbi:helix-turn-helix transcriptional regulator [uncultured Williamsia sp.]|uniref:helix-turn-helix domain-containing protein n=1 Tax=uncultured Williamsia sp. TaxID=259311 RepID=UPI002626594B|nr:helix-turn-helix transcriptional regulator [uncultured Williamsia sp.]